MALPRFPRYRAAVIQYEPTLGAKDRNVTDLLAMAEEAASQGAKLIIMPEMGTAGYCWYGREEIAPLVEPIPGPTTDKFGEVSARHECYILVALPEVDPGTGDYFNSIAFMGPDGFIGKYRKTHPFISEPKWATDGNLPMPVWSTDIGNIGALICMDSSFVETTRVLALEGADVVCAVYNVPFSGAPRPPSAGWQSRAFENGVYFLASDRWGQERGVQFAGGSAIVDPDGTVQSSLDVGDGIVYGEVDVRRAREKDWSEGGNRIRDRRPEEYDAIRLSTYTYSPLRFHGLYNYRPLPAGQRSKVAIAQMDVRPGDVSINLRKMEEMLSWPRAAGADIVVFPELATTGAVFGGRARASDVAEPVPGPTTKHLISLAMENNKHLVVGVCEREGDSFYNTAVLVGPNGLVGKYRKLHLNAMDRTWAVPGNLGLPTFDVPAGRVGLLVGYDSLLPEPARCLTLGGADLICVIGALNGPRALEAGAIRNPQHPDEPQGYWPAHWYLWRTRAGENNCYLAFANQCGETEGILHMGGSGVFAPSGQNGFPPPEVMARNSDEVVLSLEMDTTNLDSVYCTNPVRAKDIIRMRRPQWYGTVVAPEPPVLGLLLTAEEARAR